MSETIETKPTKAVANQVDVLVRLRELSGRVGECHYAAQGIKKDKCKYWKDGY